MNAENFHGSKINLKLMKLITLTIITLFTLSLTAQDAKSLIDQTVEAVGGQSGMHALKDITYTYNNQRGASQERYIFDGEVTHETFAG